jgi:hypothetical protein
LSLPPPPPQAPGFGADALIVDRTGPIVVGNLGTMWALL